jgi:hypothetical protein
VIRLDPKHCGPDYEHGLEEVVGSLGGDERRKRKEEEERAVEMKPVVDLFVGHHVIIPPGLGPKIGRGSV